MDSDDLDGRLMEMCRKDLSLMSLPIDAKISNSRKNRDKSDTLGCLFFL